MKAKNLQIILLLAVFTFFNCSNNDDPIEQDQLPPITQTGANTFGCVINSETLIPKDSNGVPNAKGLEAYYKDNETFIVDANNYNDSNSNGKLYLYIYNLNSEGSYSLDQSEGLSSFHFKPNYSHLWCRVYDKITGNKKYISTTNSGTVQITKFDEINNIVSGVFNNLTLVNIDDSNDTIQIINGRFDINLNTVNN
jgi:hypothetical protein|tara:strand:+ start:539 stop:1126 length:588 start_codon:yes stop_codon:yes gene_type:complete